MQLMLLTKCRRPIRGELNAALSPSWDIVSCGPKMLNAKVPNDSANCLLHVNIESTIRPNIRRLEGLAIGMGPTRRIGWNILKLKTGGDPVYGRKERWPSVRPANLRVARPRAIGLGGKRRLQTRNTTWFET